MSHQVQLSKLVYTDIEALKRAIAAEGLQTTTVMHGYYQKWNTGDVHPSGKLQFGIQTQAGKSPCGIIQNAKGQYELVGDAYNVSYKGIHGLGQLSTNLNVNYQVERMKDVVAAKGWEFELLPENTLKAGSNEELHFILSSTKTRQTLTTCI